MSTMGVDKQEANSVLQQTSTRVYKNDLQKLLIKTLIIHPSDM